MAEKHPSRRKETAVQFAPSQADKKNNGVSSAEPRVLSGDEEGDATFSTTGKPQKK